MEVAPGTVLMGKYRVDEVLGTGGMGQVVRASHLYMQHAVAIKILLSSMAESAATVTRFLREAQAAVGLKSEHIVKVFDVAQMPAIGDHPPTPYIVMELLEGNDLNQILRHHGPQAPQIVCDLMLQACEGMAEAHAMGIIHRDIKPSNFFITRRADGTMLLKILDFGISKTTAMTELTNADTVLGTPTYMAPEQMKTSKNADPRSDIWSIGVVMYQLISGRPPFSGESYAELVLKVNQDMPAPIMVPLPPGLGEVIMRCLEKNPALRPQNVGELARQLAPYASDPVAAAQSSARTTRTLQHRTSNRNVDALPLTAGGGLATPAPLSPSQLTPRGWPPSSTSLSHGAGQVTHKVRGGRGVMIAAIVALVILAGVGGFVASSMLGKDKDSPQVAANAPPPPTGEGSAEPAITAPPTPTPDLPPPTPTIEDPEATAKAKAEAKAAEAKAKAEAKAAEEKARADAKAAAKAKAADDARAKAEAKARAAEEARAKRAEAKAKAEADRKARAEEIAKAKAKAKTKPREKPGEEDDLFGTRK